MPAPNTPLLIKRYASRRLYNTETSDYVTLEDIASFIRDGREVKIVDLKSGSVVEWVRLDGPVTELFDVAFIEGVKCPMALGQQSPENLSLITIEGG